MILTVSIWRPHEFEEQLTYVENNNITVTKIIYFGQYEPSCTVILLQDGILVKLLSYANMLEIPIFIVTNNLSMRSAERLITTKNIKLIKWETFYFANLWSHMSYQTKVVDNQSIATQYNIELFHFLTNKNTKNYHYICMNNHPKFHKWIMMDTLAKHDLIKYGAISWLQGGYKQHGRLEKELAFNFKYWIPKILKLDVDVIEGLGSTYFRGKIPLEYNYSFMHLITESTANELFISEKTPIALLLMKPFLVIGSKGFHQNLERLGFKLYDEIFDYSFDLENTVEARCEGVARNIKKISNLSIEELTNLYNVLLNKLKYNRRLALNFATTIPDEVRELWNMKDQFINPNFDIEFANLIDNLDN